MMICATTTPFQFKDAIEVLKQPVSQIEFAWMLLQPHFGTSVTFGCGRNEALPNFYDILAMSALIALSARPIELERLVKISSMLANEVALCIENYDLGDPLGAQHRTQIYRQIQLLMDEKISDGAVKEAKVKPTVAKQVIDVLQHVRKTLLKNSLVAGAT